MLAILSLLAATAFAVPTITTKGSKFFTSNGNQWYVKGVAYQLTSSDPLAQGDQCQLDAALMQTLGANAIRVYHVDASLNHDACMTAFSNAGIYVFLDLDTFDTYITTTPSWNQDQFDAFAAVMDAFHSYDNVAGFFVGNEGITDGATAIAAPYIKAAARDMKAYRDQKGYRNIPVGYSAADIAELRPNLQNYLACGQNQSDAVDFYSLNAYEWCGQSTFQQSGYSALQANAEDYNVPIFFSETGCNTVPPRTFGDQAAILGDDMDGTWSGAIIYEWIEETNNYGLVSYGPAQPDNPNQGTSVIDGYTRLGTPTPVSPDFANLSNQWKTLNPTGISEAAYSPSLTPPACPSFTSGAWAVNGQVDLPTIGQVADAAVSSSITAGTSAAAQHTGMTSITPSTSSASSIPPSSSIPSPSSASNILTTSMPPAVTLSMTSMMTSSSAGSSSISENSSTNSAPGTGASSNGSSARSSGASGSAGAQTTSPSTSGNAASSVRASVIGGGDAWLQASIMGAGVVMSLAVFL